MEPILALAIGRSVAGLVSSLVAPPAPAALVQTKAPVARGPFVKAASGGKGFEGVLRDEMGKRSPAGTPLSFTAEAARKLEMMGVRLTQGQYDRLLEGVKEAAARGSQNSLIMMDGMAFTVDVRGGNVLDVADRSRVDNKVYTKIDSVVETKI